jgi:hypothetical protein
VEPIAEHWRQRERCPKLWKWITDNRDLIYEQFRLRRRAGDRRAPWPRTSASLEARGEKIKAWITPRRYSFANRERLNCLLTLMQLEVNGDASERDYTVAIRDLLHRRGGHAPPRRIIADHGRTSSLLAKQSARQITRARRGRQRTRRSPSRGSKRSP